MAFPVDILTNVDHESLEQAAEEYMSQLSYRKTEYLTLPNSKQIKIGLNVSFVPLYGTDTKKKILALFSPDDSITVVGLYLLGKWWGVEDILKTADPSRTGLIKVSTLGERIVLYVLNRIVLRNEKSSEEVLFLCHGEHESAKILWKDGVAIGFYSFKPKGSLCRNFVTQCYQLPVMDTVFVRKCHRGKDHGVKILEDFVCSFRNEDTGLKFPLSEAMYKVCEKYLRIYPANKEFLWEVEYTGSFFQRTLIAKRLQGLNQKEKDHVVSKLIFEEEDATAPMEIEITKIQETTESTMEIEETITDIMKDDIPVTRRSTSSNLKRRGIRENSEERLSENIIRVEDIEAGVATEGSLDNTFPVKDSETVIRGTTDTVTATVTRISAFRGSQKEMGKYIITATSDGNPVTHLTTSEEIKSKKGSKEEFEMVKEHTVEIQGTIIGSTDQSQIQSVVNVEIVKMSTGTEEEQHENLENIIDVEKEKSVSETGKGEIKQMLDKLEGGNAQSETDKTFNSTEVLQEITEQPEIHAKLREKEQVYWDEEITERKEREGSEVMEVQGKDLIEENRNDNLGPEKCEALHKDTVLQQSVEIKDQTEMEVLCTEEVLCEQQKQCEAEKVSEPHQRKTYKGTGFEKAKKNKVGPDDTKQVFSQSKLTQKRTSPETPSRRSKRLRHEPAETVRTTKSVKTTQQRNKHHSKAVIQEEHTEQPVDKSEHDSSEVIEESSAEHQTETENEVKECIKNMLTVETVSTMDNEIRQVEKTLDVVTAVSELVKGAAKFHEAPQESSVRPIEVQETKTTFEEHEEGVAHSKTKVVIVEFHEVSSKKAGDDHEEMDIIEQDELKDCVSTEQQIAEDTLEVEEQDGTLNMDTKPIEEPACTTEGYIVATDVSVTQEQENTSEVKDLIVQGKDEKTETEQSKKDQRDSYEEAKQYPKQGEQAKKKRLTDVSSRSTRLRDQPVDPGVTPVRRSTRGKEVIQQKLCEPQAKVKILTKERIVMDKKMRPEESEMTNTKVDEAIAASPGSSELLIATETDDKVEIPQITQTTEEKIPAVEAENDDATEKAIKEIKKMANKEINLAGETDIEMSSLVQEQDINEKEAPVSTEISLRHRTIKVTSTPRKKSGRVQKREDEVVVEHQETHTLMSKKKIEIISVTEERHEFMEQYVSKLENTGASLAELGPVEKTEISKDKYEEISATTEEVVNVCTLASTTETCLEEMSNANVEETVAVELKSSEILIGIDIDDKAEKIQIVEGPEEEVSEADHDEGAERDDGTQIIRLQKSTVVLVDLSQVSQDREYDESSDVLRHSETLEQLKLDKTEKNENKPEEDEQQEKILEKEKMKDTAVEKYKLDKLNEEQLPTEDQRKHKNISSPSLEKPVQENLDEAAVTTERSLRRRTIQVHSPPKRKYRHIQKQKAETLGHTTELVLITEKRADEGDQVCAEIDNEDKAPHELNVKAAEKGIPEEDVAEKEIEEINKMVHKETSLAVTKNTSQEVPQMREEAASEQQENHPLAQNKEETVEKENLTDLVVSTEQTNISKGTIVQVEKEVSQVECIKPYQSDQEGITRRSLRVSTKSVKSTQKTRASTQLYKAESEPVKEVDMNRDEHEVSSATTEETVNVCESVIIVETNLESLDELANTNVEETPAVEPETSQLLQGVEIDGKEEEPQTVEVVPFEEAEPDDLVEKDDRTSVIQLQNATLVLVDLNKLSQNTEGECDTPETPQHSQTDKNIELEGPIYSEHQLCNVTPKEKEQQELQIEKDTKKTHKQDKMDEENTKEEKNEPNKQDMTFERQKLTENWEEQIGVIETENIEGYSAVTSGENQEVTKLADKTNIIKETEQEQDVALLEKQADSKAEMSGIARGAADSVQEILEEDPQISTERSLRRRTIIVQSPPRKKSRRVQKQEAEAFEDKTGKLTVTEKVVEVMNKEITKIDGKEEKPQKSTVETTDEEIPLAEEEPKECAAEKVAEEINQVENKVTYTHEEILETEEANLVQQGNDPLVINEKQTTETEESLEMDPVVSKGKPYIVEGTTIQVEEEVSQMECNEPNQSGHEGITRRSLRLSTKSVKTTQKTRSSTRLHKAESEPVKEVDMSTDVYEETSTTTEKTMDVCVPVITVKTNLKSLDELANTDVEETAAVEPETSETLLGVEIDGKEEEPQTVEEVPLEEAEPDNLVGKDDITSVIQLQNATVVLVDLNKLSQNTDEERDTPEISMHSQTRENIELEEPIFSEHELCNVTPEEKEQQELQIEKDTKKTHEQDKMDEENTEEEKNEPNKQDMTFESQKLTEDLEEQIDVIEKETIESYSAVTSGENQEVTQMADKTNIIKEIEQDQDVALLEKQADTMAEMSDIAHGAADSVQEILEEETPFSTERSLRRRTIIVQSPPRKKTRRLQKQEPEAFEEQTGKLTVTGKVVEKMNKEMTKIDGKEEMPQKSTVETTDEEIPLAEDEPKECEAQKVVEEINQVENKVTYINEEILETEEASLVQQGKDPLAINEKQTTETEESLEMDPVVSKGKPYIVEGTTIHVEEEVSQVECNEPNQSGHEGITRRSLRLSTKSVKTTQKTRSSTRLHKVESEPVKEVDMSTDVYEESSATTEETMDVCVPIITVETNLKSIDELANTDVEETPAVEPETSDPILGVEIGGKEEEHQTVEEVPLEEVEPDNSVGKDDIISVIQLQNARVVLVDLNKFSQNTDEERELEEPIFNEHELCNVTPEEKEQQELQIEKDTKRTQEQDKMDKENTDKEKNEPNKQDMIFERQKLTEDLEEQIDVIETETIESFSAVTSGENQEVTQMADKTNIIKETEQDQDVALLKKQADSKAEMSGIAHGAAESFQEILEEETPFSTERSLRRRTIIVQSPPRKKSRRVQKQGTEAFEDKTGKLTVTGKVVEKMNKEMTKIDGKEEMPQKSTVETTDEEIPLAEDEPKECEAQKVAEEINQVENKVTYINEEILETEEASLVQQGKDPLAINEKQTTETKESFEMDPVVSKGKPYIVEGTTIHVEEEVSQVECNEPNQSGHEGITRRSLRLSTKSVKTTQKTRSSTRLHKVESEPVKEVDMSTDVYEESSATTEETMDVCVPIITVETNLESIDELANTDVEETPAVEPETSDPILGVEIGGKEEEPQTVEEVPLEEAEPDKSVGKDDIISVIQLQNARVVLVDLNKFSQNTDEERELEEPIFNEHELCNVTPEEKEQQELQIEKDTKKTQEQDKMDKENTDKEKNEPNKQDMIFESQKLTEDLEEQIDVIETETIESYSAVTSGENQEVTQMADKTNIIKETEQDQDVALLKKQADSKAEMSGIAHGAADSVQEILEEETPFSAERSLRRRTIIVQSPPRKKPRRVQKQGAEAFEDKTGKLTVTGKVDEEMNKEITKIDGKEEMPQKSTVETTYEEIPLAEEEPNECEAQKVAEEINQVGNKVTYINEEILETEKANLVQESNDPLVINEKQTTETEESLEIDPAVSKGQPYIVEGTTIQVEEEVSRMECNEPNQSGHERITRRSLRLSTKSVKTTRKTRSSTRLHKAEFEPVKDVDINRDVYEEYLATTEETVNVCKPVIWKKLGNFGKNLESLDELANTDVEEAPAVEPETSEPLLGVEIDGKEEEPQTVAEDPLEKAELNNLVQKDDRTSVIQLQNATVVLVDLNKPSQNTEGESDTPEFPTRSQTEENMELDKPVYSEHRMGNLTSKEEENQVLQMGENIEKTPELEKMQEEDTDEQQNKPIKQDETFEGGQNLTEDSEEQIYVMEKKHLEATAIADKSNIIQDGETDQDFGLKEKQTESEAEMSSLLHESVVSVQEILEDEAPVSIERRLRQRTIKVQSTPRKISRGVEKQEASGGKRGKVQITRKAAKEMHKESAKVDGKEETIKQSTVEATENMSFIEVEPIECVAEKVAEEINKIENKETNLVVAKDTDEEAPDMKRAANLEQHETYPLAINVKQTAETEKPMEINEDPVVNKEQTNVYDEATIHLVGEEVSHVETTERIKRRSLRIGAKSVTLKQKTRKSTRLHNAELELAKEADMSRDEFEETSTTTGETSLQSFNKTVNMNVEETPAVEPETSELLIGVETFEEGPQTVEEALLKDTGPDEGAKDDDTPVIQLQKATVILVDLNKHTQNTEGESNTSEAPPHSQTEENMELDNPVYSEHQLCHKRREEEQQELQKEEDTKKALEEDKVEEERTDEEQNDPGKQDITSEGQKPKEDLKRQIDVQRTIVQEVIHVHMQEAVTSGEHSEATIMIDKTNMQEAENDQNIALKDKHADSDVEISYLGHKAAVAVPEALEEEAPVSTERSLRRRTIPIQSPLKRKSRRLQKQEAKAFEDKTTKVPITGKAVDEHQEAKIDEKEQTLQKSTVEATSEEIPPVETEPEECVAEKVENMENKEIQSGNEEAPKMEKEEAILEQQKNKDLVENIMETDEVLMVAKEQTYIVEETTIQAELELTKEADMSRNEDNLSITIETLEVHVQSKTTETNDGGKVDGSLHNISTDKKEVEIEGSIKKTENTEETQKDLDEGVQEEEKAEENTDQELEENIQDKTENEMITHQEQVVSQEDNVWETNPAADCKSTVIEAKVALEKTEQDTSLITRRSLRSRTVTVQSTPRRMPKRLHRHEVEPEKETKSDTCGNENDTALPQLADDLSITVENIAEFEDTKEQEDIILLNTEEKAAEIETREDTVEKGKEIHDKNEQEKTHNDNLEREDVQVSKEQDEVSDVLDEKKHLKEIQYESSADVQECSYDMEETRKTLRKRTIVEEAAPRKSKCSRKVHSEDIEHVKVAVLGSESVEEYVELRSDESVIFEVSNSGEEILQQILRNTEENNRQIENTETLEEVISEQCLEADEQPLESIANEGFTLELEVEETSDLEENRVDEDSSVSIEAPKEVSTFEEKLEGEENTSDNDKKGLSIEKHVRRSSKATGSARRKSMRLQMLESKKKTNESDLEESEVRYQRKRKAITDLTPARRSKRHARGKNV
ncbi:titin [Danio aesculapii]|uniref:titin n=1 Tax=Danio aesculapii TaxID=1142201 RepID=UPI0024C0C19C|nr:titin [Danio aesculapii]